MGECTFSKLKLSILLNLSSFSESSTEPSVHGTGGPWWFKKSGNSSAAHPVTEPKPLLSGLGSHTSGEKVRGPGVNFTFALLVTFNNC